VQLPTQIRTAIEQHGRFCFPDEACGLVAGDDDDPLRMAFCLTNTDRSGNSFTIDPDEHFGALRHAEKRGWRITGSFHSHPESTAVPSAADIAGALDPEWIYLIAGPIEPGPIAVRAYRILKGRVVAMPLDSGAAA
jgi:proteasome lid subunit RPN8/RPN11